MSRTHSKLTNKHQKHPKVHFQQYLYNAGEPPEHMSGSMPPELEAELLENSESMRRSFRHYASRMRSQ